MKKAWLVIAAAALAIVALVIFDKGEPPGGGEPVTYSARSFDGGEKVSTDDLRGSPALLTSWASWCTECRTELPQLEDFWKSKDSNGLQVVAVNLDSTGGDGPAARAAAEFGLTMPIWSDTDGRFTGYFHGIGVPMSVLLDGDGEVVKVWQGPIDFSDAKAMAPIHEVLREN
ncbi:MAG: TlpA disulfide reductase family protein [Solirubrobacterales bacterium]